jgi:hypothetical protein
MSNYFFMYSFAQICVSKKIGADFDVKTCTSTVTMHMDVAKCTFTALSNCFRDI